MGAARWPVLVSFFGRLSCGGKKRGKVKKLRTKNKTITPLCARCVCALARKQTRAHLAFFLLSPATMGKQVDSMEVDAAPKKAAVAKDAPPPSPPPPPPVLDLLAQAATLLDKAGKSRDVRGLPGRALRLAAGARARVSGADVATFVVSALADGDAKVELLSTVKQVREIERNGGCARLRGEGGRALDLTPMRAHRLRTPRDTRAAAGVAHTSTHLPLTLCRSFLSHRLAPPPPPLTKTGTRRPRPRHPRPRRAPRSSCSRTW